MSDSSATSALPLRLCIGWGIGTFGVSIMFNSITILMQRYATDFLGVAAITWGFIYLGSKIYDAITDPLMGIISDRTKSRLGRRRPYLLFGGLLSVLAFLALFYAPSLDENPATVMILLGGLLLYSTGYTIFNVPYMAMLSEMTQDYKERARLVSFRVYAIGLGTMVGLALGPALVGYFGGGKQAHHAMAAIFACLILVSFLLCFFLTKDAEQTSPSNDPTLGFINSIKLIWANRPFMQVLGLKFILLSGIAVNQTLLIYFVQQVLGKSYGFLGVYGLIAAFSTMLGPFFCLRLMHKFDKRSLYVFAAVIHAIFMFTWLVSGPQEAEWIIIARGAILGLSAGAMLMMGQAMLPDAINYETLKTGLHREGIYSGLYITAEKLAFALGGALPAFILGFSGYLASTTGSIEQPESAIQAIYFCVGVLPAALALLSCLFLIGYDLSEQKLDQLKLARANTLAL